MKPKTAVQREVQQLSYKLHDITQEQLRWAKNNLFKRYYYKIKNQQVCLHCGHRWDTKEAKLRCPNCKQYLKKLLNDKDHPRLRTQWDYNYFTVITTVDNFQVIRHYYFKQRIKVDCAVEYEYREIVQHWIKSDGKHVVKSILTSGLNMYRSSTPWNLMSEMEIRKYICDYHYLWGVAFPKQRILPEIIRNGFYNDYFELHPAYLFSLLLSNTYAETLIKTNQVNLLGKFDKYEKDIVKYWPQIKICIRRNYTIYDPSIWFDHLRLLIEFDKDIYNSHYICPRDLDNDHNYYIELKAKKLKKQKELELEEENKQYILRHKKFLNLNFVDKDLNITPLKSVSEFFVEAETMHHCVFSPHYYSDDNKLILSAKINNTRIATIEFNTKTYEIVQCRGKCNEHTKHYDRIINLISNNIDKIKELQKPKRKVSCTNHI